MVRFIRRKIFASLPMIFGLVALSLRVPACSCLMAGGYWFFEAETRIAVAPDGALHLRVLREQAETDANHPDLKGKSWHRRLRLLRLNAKDGMPGTEVSFTEEVVETREDLWVILRPIGRWQPARYELSVLVLPFVPDAHAEFLRRVRCRFRWRRLLSP